MTNRPDPPDAAGTICALPFDARRRNFPVEPSLPLADRLRVTARAVPALAVPLVVTVGIYGGVVTEAAALSAAVALLVSLIFYRGFHWTETLKVITDGIRSAGTIMLIVATALAFGHWMTESGIPNQLVNFVIGHGFATWQFLLIINGLLLLLGCFLEVTTTLLLVLPILAPALKPLGVDPVHFDHLYAQHGDRTGPPAGRAQPVRALDDLVGADRRGDPRHPALSDPAADCARHHHLCADPDAMAAGCGVRVR
jgi:tripartite ATP-independent transporter DctM subunit